MTSRADQQRVGLAGAAVAVIVWGASGVVAKELTMSAPAIAVYRFAMYGTALWLFLTIRRKPFGLHALKRSLPGGICLALDVFFYFYAVKHTSVTNATLIGALQPILIMALSMPLFGEKPGRRDVLAALVAIGGVVAVVVISAGEPTWSGIGDLSAVAAMLSWGGYFITSRRAQETLSSTEFTAGTSFWTAALNIPIGLALQQDMSGPSSGQWPLLLFMTFGVGFFGSSLMNWSISRVPLWLASTMTLIIPIVASFLAWWFLDEPLTAPQGIAMAVVVGALAVIVIGQSTNDTPADDPMPSIV